MLWQIFNEIVDNQDLYKNKDDLRDFIFNKYICKMYKLYNDLQLKIG